MTPLIQAQKLPESLNHDPINPYLAARREWNERYGSYIQEAQHWRLCALIAMGLTLVAVSGAIYIGSQSKMVPYVIGTDTLGRVNFVGLPQAQGLDERSVQAFLADWISHHRSVVTDRTVQMRFIEKTYAMIAKGSPMKTLFDQWYTVGHDPFVRAQSMSVSVEVESVLKLSGQSYQIEWQEKPIDSRGQALVPERYRAIVSLEKKEVDHHNVLSNPLGIYLTAFSTQRI